MPNSFSTLSYEPAFELLGGDFYDVVAAAEFPQHQLRFRNDEVLKVLGIDPDDVSDEDFISTFGKFQDRQPFLAMRYHGYQFGEYNPFLGDGRGFLYGQVRGVDGELYDFGTKGSGPTPYSRGGDGRLTLKGGVREVIAAEALHRYGVKTSRCLSLVETGEALWRGDEPSPTRSSVMVRFSRSHIRFGTFERLHYFKRPDLIQTLLDHVIEYYYRHLWEQPDREALFYDELVKRVATLTAQWMSVGFCHAVLNTDNMSITGESFDYGPYAFLNTYDPVFTAAYFDYGRRYCFKNQPIICRWNLELLQAPLRSVISQDALDAALAQFDDEYQSAYQARMLAKLGIQELGSALSIDSSLADEVVAATLAMLYSTQVGYYEFFRALRQQFEPEWADDPSSILADVFGEMEDETLNAVIRWREVYGRSLQTLSPEKLEQVSITLARHNPDSVPIRSEIEAIWEPIVLKDDWQPFYELLKQIRHSVIE
ncbi:MAG: YdiU family protein [Leptolyngbyaceae bacterium]|nr:YdiU family protein [Leptolyngbyaceae bacterium]